MVSIDNISNNNTSVSSSTTANVSKTKEKKETFIDIFKNYFNNNIKKGEENYHDVTVDDVKNTAKQVYDSLIHSGVKVVAYDRKTGMTEFDNGVTIYYKAEDNKALFEVSKQNEDGSYENAEISTDESGEGTDINELQFFNINDKQELYLYSSTLKADSKSEIIDEQHGQNGDWLVHNEIHERDSSTEI